MYLQHWRTHRRTLPLLAQVTLSGGEGQPAKVVGFDEDKDVAVLQIDAKDMEVLQPARW